MPARDASLGGFPTAGEFRPRTLHRRVLTVLLFGSLVPFTILGVGAWLVFGGILAERARDHLRTVVRDHAATVDLFLDEWLAALRMVASLDERDAIVAPERLARVLADLEASFSESFVDLGVIDGSGEHLAYAGPYDLLGKNYRDAEWFERVVRDGRWVSDVFLGHRNVPHFVMAVRRNEPDGRFWILRATVNSEVFDRLVSTARLGTTGECFVVDREGRYQTSPPSRLSLDVIRVTEPINGGRWTLVAVQDEAEVMAPVRRALFRGVLVFAAGAAAMVLTAFLATRFLVRLVERGVRRTEELDRHLLRAGQLASIGEMATGLAHEINNPLAIILSEQTNVSDLLAEMPPDARTTEISESVARTKRQVDRCKAITLKMLQFGRQTGADAGPIDPEPPIREIVRLLEPQARVANAALDLRMPDGLAPVRIDPGELQQVVTNLVVNAIQAMPAGGRVTVSAWDEGGEVHLAVSDTGPGVPPELRTKLFEPFFTTKPVGRGTGLGLAVCWGIVTRWRGRISCEDGSHGGARFHVVFPAANGAREAGAKG